VTASHNCLNAVAGLVSDTRELTAVKPYIIVYRLDSQAIQIVRIRHRLRDRSEP